MHGIKIYTKADVLRWYNQSNIIFLSFCKGVGPNGSLLIITSILILWNPINQKYKIDTPIKSFICSTLRICYLNGKHAKIN